MDVVASNPYEQKLYHMFLSHDIDSVGSLDKEALLKLCKTLELKDTGITLVKCLLLSDKKRVTFTEFKAGLLNFLGNEMSANINCENSLVKKNHENTSSVEEIIKEESDSIDSPGREVSPKFVVGAKKYGRRSRPQSQEIESSQSDTDNETVNINNNIITSNKPKVVNTIIKSQKVQRSASQSDINGNKRRRPAGTKLKRCASLPAQKYKNEIPSPLVKTHLESSIESLGNIDFENLSHSVYEIWSTMGGKIEQKMNREQLEKILVIAGLNKIAAKVAEEVFEKLNVAPDMGIHYIDFIKLLQNDTDIMASENSSDDSPTVVNCNPIDDLPTNEHESLTADWSKDSNVATERVIDMWEAAGIVHADRLLRGLGFAGEEVQVSLLSIALDEELLELHDEESATPLLRASLALHKAEVIALRVALKQLAAENRKLHTDNRDVNRRAALLAQEIDERHASLENSTQTEIRLMEQRHGETVRQLTAQLANDREHWANINNRLETRLKLLEHDESQYKNEINILNNEISSYANEQTVLHNQLTDLLETNIKLNSEIAELEDKYKSEENIKGDRKHEEVLEYIDKIRSLQVENSSLRDKNDEFTTEIEALSVELSKMRTKKGTSLTHRSCSNQTEILKSDGDENTILVEEEESSNFTIATKRRGDSPSKTRMTEESPRLGKLRKCSNDNSGESETSGDWMALNSELSQSISGGATTSGFSQETSISDVHREELKNLREKIEILRKELENYKANEKHEENVESVTKENVQYKNRIVELEASLEQMQKEYEDCEDYWQSKLNEERQLFEEEQKVSDEKFNELLKKMSEYEEQFAAANENNGRLTPIQENVNLEQQYADLETELFDFKTEAQQVIDTKADEINELKNEIKSLQTKLDNSSPNTKQQNSTANSTDTRTDTESPASSPISYLWNQSTIHGPARDYQNPNWQSKNKIENENKNQIGNETVHDNLTISASALEEDITPIIRNVSPIQKPPTPISRPNSIKDGLEETISVKSEHHSVASTYSIHQNSLPNSNCPSPTTLKDDVKRLKLLELQMREEVNDLMQKRDNFIIEIEQLRSVKPVLEIAYARAAHPNLLHKIQQLEQKNHHLKNSLRQQHQYTEKIMHQNWQQQRAEISELRNRLENQTIVIADQAQHLTNADQLVKDLFVENSHLSATIQRLEQQRSRGNLIHQHPAQNFSGVPGMP